MAGSRTVSHEAIMICMKWIAREGLEVSRDLGRKARCEATGEGAEADVRARLSRGVLP